MGWAQIGRPKPSSATSGKRSEKKMGDQFLEKYGAWAVVTGSGRKEGVGYGFATQLNNCY